MRMWIDTEFNGFGGELLSIALLAEDGSYLYKVIYYPEIKICEWVQLHVIPYILQNPLTEIKDETLVETKSMIQNQLKSFLMKYDSVEIIADWPDDIKYFCDLLIIGPGYAIDTPKELKFTIDRELDSISKLPHHAYYDALGNMEATLTKEWYIDNDY